jgi:hypothetical protein
MPAADNTRMALYSDAAMVLFYDIAGDNADHDEWHTYEHMHERLSVPGFLRATRWVAKAGTPNYMVIYELSGTDIGTSAAYLERLNHPTPWTTDMMGRFRHMIRGFCDLVASAGFGFGHAALSVRFTPREGEEASLRERLEREVLPSLAARRGMASVHLFRPGAPPPMTSEQALRGRDTPMTWLLLASAYDAGVLGKAAAEQLRPETLEWLGAAPGIATGTYLLQYMASAREVERTPRGTVVQSHGK